MCILGNHGDDEGIPEASILEILRSVIEDEVDSRKLLKSLQPTTSEEAFADGTL